MHKKQRGISRRQFIARSAAAAAFPLFLPRRVFGANSRINVAWIGAGQMGNVHLRGLSPDLVNLVSVCDASTQQFGPWIKEKHLDVAFYQDFRVMLDELGGRVDAVGIATPDHVHFPAAYMAIARGKHVFVEKPMAHSVWETRTLLEYARSKGVKTQMGIQGHLSEGIRLIKEWYHAGLIGEVREVIAWTDRPASGVGFSGQCPREYPKPTPVPDHLDWELWRGPVTDPIEYSHRAFTPLAWRPWWAFGCGGLGDIGCHTLDAPFWALEPGPLERIDVERPEEPNPIHTVGGSLVTYRFRGAPGKPPVVFKWYEGPRMPEFPDVHGIATSTKSHSKCGGMLMIGETGAIGHVDIRPNSPRLFPAEKWEAFRKDPALRPPKTLARVRASIFGDLLNAIRDDHATSAGFEYAAPLTELALLGSLAIRTGKPVEFDANSLRITNNPEADALLKTEARKGWDMTSLG